MSELDVEALKRLRRETWCQCGAEQSHSAACISRTNAGFQELRRELMRRSDAIIAALEDREQLRAELKAVLEAWSESWDCSRDPGHQIMNAAVAALEGRDV